MKRRGIPIARLNNEPNTFSPVPMPLQAFGPNALTLMRMPAETTGVRVLQCRHSSSWRKKPGAEVIAPVSTSAIPRGPVDTAAGTVLCESILRGEPSAATLDAFGKEPLPMHAFGSDPRIVVAPHIADHADLMILPRKGSGSRADLGRGR
ncbi:M81 family metallopeptidase [Variovorax sp. HW608]|uniref:M81 family metallopeptidase n=1 Tax=Variovorax sp. HW608 TaxID=1034889 RepID=UPI0012FDEE2F|nr:M81 family metallopeptidase [Variovorax sp. HW608]